MGQLVNLSINQVYHCVRQTIPMNFTTQVSKGCVCGAAMLEIQNGRRLVSGSRAFLCGRHLPEDPHQCTALETDSRQEKKISMRHRSSHWFQPRVHWKWLAEQSPSDQPISTKGSHTEPMYVLSNVRCFHALLDSSMLADYGLFSEKDSSIYCVCLLYDRFCGEREDE